MQCGELVFRKVPVMTQDTSAMGLRQKPETETIHSGHFMVSHFEAEAQDDEDELAVPVPDAEQAKLTVVGVTPVGFNAQTFISANRNDRSSNQQLSIETSLTKLFQCMSLAYRQKLTSPKWNRFKGIRLRWKDKIRLNNVIWRCWHMQFITKQKTLVCQFASPLDVDTHNKPEAVVLEGKYWKRRLAAVTAEYKKWRLFHRNRVLGWGNKDGSDVLSEIDMLEWQPHSDEGIHMLVDEDYMELMSDTLFSTISANQPFAFPDSREIARAGLADFIQPSLGPLQPNLEDFMDTLEPLQEFIHFKLPPVPEEPSNEDLYRPISGNYSDLDLLPAADPHANMQTHMVYQDDSMGGVSALMGSQQSLSSHVANMDYAALKQQYDQTELSNSYGATANSRQMDGLSNISLYGQAANLLPPIPAASNRPSRAVHRTNKLSRQIQNEQIGTQQSTSMQQSIHNQRSLQAKQKSLQNQQSVQSALLNQQQAIHHTLQQQHQQAPVYSNSLDLAQFANYHNLDMTGNSTSLSDMLSGAAGAQCTFKIPSPPPLMNLQPNFHKSPSTARHNLKFGGTSVSADNFKMPALPTGQRWSPPPAPQTFPNQTVPVQMISIVSELNVIQQQDAAQLKDPRTNGAYSTSTPNKYTATKSRGRVRSSSLGPRQTPPPLKSSASDPALLSNTNSVLLAQLLTNNSQTVFSVNNAATDKSSMLSSSGLVSNMKSTSNNVPILPSSPETTTLLISTPVTTLSSNQVLMNSFSSPASLVANSPKSMTNESPMSPLSPAESLGSPGVRNADRSPGPHREQRRVGHIHAEQKRRYNIKNGFDTLHSLIPQLNQNPNAKLSKAAMLQKGAEYIRQLKSERGQLKDEMDSLRQQIECLNTSISNCQSMLPATGAPVSRQRASKMREMFEEYVRVRTQENWKFWIFSVLFETLLASYNSSVSTSSLEDLYRSTLLWIEQHCSLVDLRPAVLNSLRILSTKTEILSDPGKLPEEAREAVNSNSRLSLQ